MPMTAKKERRYGQSFALSPAVLQDDSLQSWVQVLRTGRWYDRRYGFFDVTREMLDQMVVNLDNERARGERFYADYDHGIPYASGDGNAIVSGEILKLEVRPTDLTDERGEQRFDLFALVEWTEAAAAKIRGKEYRHTSAWYAPEHINNAGIEIGPTLLGFAITNNPVVHGMAPLSLTEDTPAMALSGGFIAFAELDENESPWSDGMKNLTWLLGRLGLGANASEEDLAAKVDQLQTQQATLTRERDHEKGRADAAEATLAKIREVFGFGKDGDMVALCTTLSAQLREARESGRKAEVDAFVQKMLGAHKLLPAEKDYFTTRLMEETANGTKVEETATGKLLNARAADPRTTASGAGGEQPLDDEDKELERLASKHLKEDADLIELSKTDRAAAILKADERALQDLNARKRETATA